MKSAYNYGTLNCSQKWSISCASNQHFYPVCNNTYKNSYISPQCMAILPGGHVNSCESSYNVNKLSNKQLKKIKTENEQENEEDEEYNEKIKKYGHP